MKGETDREHVLRRLVEEEGLTEHEAAELIREEGVRHWHVLTREAARIRASRRKGNF